MNSRFLKRRRQRGAAAVEATLVLLAFIVSIGVMLFLARYMWHYTAAQKASQDASQYFSRVSEQELRSPTLHAAALALTKSIAYTELQELNPGDFPATIGVNCPIACDYLVASTPLPVTVSVKVAIPLFDPIFGVWTGPYGSLVEATSELRYVGK